MEQVRLFVRPRLRRPAMVAAFAGWNDAAQSATSAVRFLARTWSADRFGEIEPDEFFDFTQTRPLVRIVEGIVRRLEWPGTELFYHQNLALERDYVLLLGVEPHLRWKTFVSAILAVCRELGIDTIVTLGGLLADVPHTHPTKVLGFSNDPALGARLLRLNAEQSHYEGPTGIVGVLNATAAEQGLRTASIWGSVPMYLQAIPNPKVTLDLLRRLDGLLDLSLSLLEMEEMSRQFDKQVAEVIAKNPQIAAYVQQLEDKERAAPEEEPSQPAAGTADLPAGDSLVEDIEEFLRRMRREGGDAGKDTGP